MTPLLIKSLLVGALIILIFAGIIFFIAKWMLGRGRCPSCGHCIGPIETQRLKRQAYGQPVFDCPHCHKTLMANPVSIGRLGIGVALPIPLYCVNKLDNASVFHFPTAIWVICTALAVVGLFFVYKGLDSYRLEIWQVRIQTRRNNHLISEVTRPGKDLDD